MTAVAYRQPIRLGDSGTDVLAVKRALKKAGFGNGLVMNRVAGAWFVRQLKRWQTHNHIPSDGVYGPESHVKLSPGFDAYGRLLYRSAALRIVHSGPMSAQEAAQQLLAYRSRGLYRSDNPGDLYDIEATAKGFPVRNRSGRTVYIDHRPLELLCYLIAHGFSIGTSAICSDHHDDGPHGHAGGYACDIDRINGRSVSQNDYGTRSLVLAVDRLIGKAGKLRPRQLISGGYGNHRDTEISRYSIPGADSVYGSITMSQHCNHIHEGF